MSKTAFTVEALGAYVVLLGVTRVLVPNFLLGLSGIPATSEVWVGVVGLALGGASPPLLLFGVVYLAEGRWTFIMSRGQAHGA